MAHATTPPSTTTEKAAPESLRAWLRTGRFWPDGAWDRTYSPGMEEEPATTLDAAPDAWATRTAKSLSLAYTASSCLFAGAAAALLLAVIGAFAVYRGISPGDDLGDVISFGSSSAFTVSQMTTILVGGLLPAGLLGAAGVALRLQAARFEAEFVD